MAKIVITTKQYNDKGEVKVKSDDAEFIDMMMATEYMMHITCQQSKAGYDKGQELLCKGAMTYKEKK